MTLHSFLKTTEKQLDSMQPFYPWHISKSLIHIGQKRFVSKQQPPTPPPESSSRQEKLNIWQNPLIIVLFNHDTFHFWFPSISLPPSCYVQSKLNPAPVINNEVWKVRELDYLFQLKAVCVYVCSGRAAFDRSRCVLSFDWGSKRWCCQWQVVLPSMKCDWDLTI